MVRSAQRNVWLDLFKFFLCYLVICIHLLAESYSYFPIYRIAVPMFFIISGYFNLGSDCDNAEKCARAFVLRTFKYMVIGFGFYILFDFIMCFIDGNSVGYFFTTLFYEDFWLDFFILNRPITYTGSQLWFLIALFVVSLIHYTIVRFDKTHLYYVIIPLCFSIYFFFAGYMYLIQNTDMPIRYTRNALFFGLPNFALGYILAKFEFHKKAWYKYIYLILGIICFFLQIAEYNLIKTENCSLEMYITGVASAALILLFFVGTKRHNASFYYKWIGKNAPFYIYIFHMAVSVVFQRLVFVPNGELRCLCVLLISFIIYEAHFLLSKLILKKDVL